MGRAGRIWDRNQDEIWVQMLLNRSHIEGQGDLYPCFGVDHDYILDEEPFPWFVHLEIVEVTLTRAGPGWPDMRPITLPLLEETMARCRRHLRLDCTDRRCRTESSSTDTSSGSGSTYDPTSAMIAQIITDAATTGYDSGSSCSTDSGSSYSSTDSGC